MRHDSEYHCMLHGCAPSPHDPSESTSQARGDSARHPPPSPCTDRAGMGNTTARRHKLRSLQIAHATKQHATPPPPPLPLPSSAAGSSNAHPQIRMREAAELLAPHKSGHLLLCACVVVAHPPAPSFRQLGASIRSSLSFLIPERRDHRSRCSRCPRCSRCRHQARHHRSSHRQHSCTC